MRLIVLGSGSKGNGYILEGKTESIILEAGMPIRDVFQNTNFNLAKIVGVLVSHEHLDHSKYIKEYQSAGLDIYTSAGTITERDLSGHRIHTVRHRERFTIGDFAILPINMVHDAREPLGFIIRHGECGNVLFVTDTHYIPFKIPDLNNIIIECNYSLSIVNDNIAKGADVAVRNRVLETHMELETLKDFLQVNDITHLNNVVLCHLSDGNSDARGFVSAISGVAAGKQIWVAETGLSINFDLIPF